MRLLFLLLFSLFLQSLAAQSLEFEAHSITQEKPYVELNFEGEKPKKGYQTKLVVMNTAAETLFIKEIEAGCSCIQVKMKKKKLKQGQKTELCIQWNPPGETEFSGAIRIDSNDPQHPELWIHLMGNFGE